MSQEDRRVRRIARLAALVLDDCEMDQFDADLADMIAFVKRVEEIGLPDVPECDESPVVLRTDNVMDDSCGADLFEPDRLDGDGFLVVPPVLGEDT